MFIASALITPDLHYLNEIVEKDGQHIGYPEISYGNLGILSIDLSKNLHVTQVGFSSCSNRDKERKIKFAPHIKCEGKVNNQFYLSSTGQVFPCKHVALNIITADTSPEHKTELLYDWEKNNISNYSLEEIFTNDFYKGYFNNLLKLNPTILHNEQGGVC